MQWYVSEQMEEEALARSILDKLRLIGNEKGGMYLFDREMLEIANSTENAPKNKG
jgi:ferritin